MKWFKSNAFEFADISFQMNESCIIIVSMIYLIAAKLKDAVK